MKCPQCGTWVAGFEETCLKCGYQIKRDQQKFPDNWPDYQGEAFSQEPLKTIEILTYTGESLADEKNSEQPYYLSKWKNILLGKSRNAGFNKAAFFTGMNWIAYRKQYGLAAIWLLIEIVCVFILALIIEFAFMNRPYIQYIRLPLNILAYVIVRLPLGMLGNRLYFRKAIKAIVAERVQKPVEEDRLAAMMKKGGTSGLGLAVAIILTLLVNILIFILR
jgi:hypothetical protein